jgi:import inner membrane translocase subunit TIM22
MGAIFGVVFGQFDNDGFNAQQGAKAKLRFHLREMRQQSFSFAKQFAVVGGVYTIFECHIEKHRGKRDIWNAISAGCLAGGTLAARAGPQAAAFGCAGFAAFSGAIEHFFAS